MSLFCFTFAGGSLILIGAYETLNCATKTHRFNPITLLSTSFLSILFIFNSILSILSSYSSHDNLGLTLHLPALSIASLFLLFSVLGLFDCFSKSVVFPPPLISLMLLFGFVEEFLFFHLQFKDVDGVENRYYDLMLVPVLICVVSTIVELKEGSGDRVCYAKLGRGLGLVLQGTWFVQMGFSFFSGLIAHNCHLHRKSRGNYTIGCESHMDLHRGGAIAVLLFNCHLAFLVTVVCGVYAVVGKGALVGGGSRNYRPIGGEMHEGKFTLDSDSDEGVVEVNEISREDGNDGPRRGNASVELVVNGHGIH